MKRQFIEGESESAKKAADSAENFASESAVSQSENKPTKSTITVKDWSQVDTNKSISIITSVDSDGNETKESYKILDILNQLKTDSFLIPIKNEISVDQQKDFEARFQSLGEGDHESVQQDFANGSGKAYVGHGALWTTVDFLATLGGDENTKPTIGSMPTSGGANQVAVYDPISPVASIGYNYDYGVSERLPFDVTRVVSIDTEGEFTSQVKQGPKILGKIEYATSTPSDVNDYDSWREYGGLFLLRHYQHCKGIVKAIHLKSI